jgi:hypothetical protein
MCPGRRPIEDFRAGDWILSAPEDDPEARPEPKQVEETFQRCAAVLDLYVGSRLIRTTSAHPFYCRERGWIEAGALTPGDLLCGHGGRWTAVTKVVETPDRVTVYNLRIADHHTYFVGGADWGFSVWAHNAGGDCVGGAEAPGDWNGPTDYSSIKNPKDVVNNTKPTPRQVREMKKLNRAHNDGVLRDDVTGEVMVDSEKSTKGVKPPQNEAQVDHIVPESCGGTRSSDILQLRTRKNNRGKWNMPPGE